MTDPVANRATDRAPVVVDTDTDADADAAAGTVTSTAVREGAEAAAAPGVSELRRRLGWVAVGVWAVALATFIVTQGFPFDRGYQTLWILSGLVAASVGRTWRDVGRIFVDWVPVIVILYLYDFSRHAAEALGRPVAITPQIDADRLLFFGVVPTVWLQEHVYDPNATHWWDAVGSLWYISHFLGVWVIAAILYLRDREHWFTWTRALVVLSFAGLITFALIPTAPPWYAARDGYLPALDRISTRGLDMVGLHGARQLIDLGAATANDVAAIPSLHTAFAVLIAVWFWPRVPVKQRWWLRPFLVAYPIVMLAVLVYSGEHYVIDGIVGAIYVFGVLAGLRGWDRWRARRKAEQVAAAEPAASETAA